MSTRTTLTKRPAAPRTASRLVMAAALALLSGCAGLPGLEFRIGYPSQRQQQPQVQPAPYQQRGPNGPVNSGWQTASGPAWGPYNRPPQGQPSYGPPTQQTPQCGCQPSSTATAGLELPPVQWR